jgi:hypothetical protein
MSSKTMSPTTKSFPYNPSQLGRFSGENKAIKSFSWHRVTKWLQNFQDKKWVIRLTHKEFWDMPYLYPLIVFSYPYWAFRAKSWLFFTAANPGIETGGMMGESKAKINDMIPPPYRPQNVTISANEPRAIWQSRLKKSGITFPLIAKPVVGARGLMVEKIPDLEALNTHITRFGVDFMIEEFIDYPIEAAVLYWKNPITEQSGIFSITIKKFLTVKGNNQDTVRELLKKCFRGILQIERLDKEKPALMNSIPKCGEEKLVEPIGNHCRGTTFLNGNHLINHDMVKAFDTIQSHLDGCYFYRLDLKTPSIDDLQHGRNIKILEINGVGSEPAHIYDPEYPLWKIWRDTWLMWRKIYEIGEANHFLGIPYQTYSEFKEYVKTQDRYVKAGNK